jgi:hypothetical protein
MRIAAVSPPPLLSDPVKVSRFASHARSSLSRFSLHTHTYETSASFPFGRGPGIKKIMDQQQLPRRLHISLRLSLEYK